ncbi:MAG: hypothetical protein M9921_05400 [Fimbriimonadaceae bacterium]|nr:hypothetical protein [Fimbriimonadaceae bacterium]
MNRPWMCALAVAAFVAGLLALPKTRWLLPNQLELLSGGWELKPDYFLVPEEEADQIALPAHLEPTPRVLSIADPRDDQERMFALLREAPDFRDGEAYWGRFSALQAVCDRLDTAPTLAQFIRVASNPATWTGGPANFSNVRAKLQATVLAACARGAELDPDNAFFLLMRGAILDAQGHRDGASQALFAASNLRHYRAYEWTEVSVGRRALQSRYPRSQAEIAWLAASVVLPHLASFRTATRNFTSGDEPANRAAVVRIGGLLLRDGTSPIDPFVGFLLISHALKPKGEPNLLTRLSPEEARTRATVLAEETDDPLLDDLALDYGRFFPAMSHGRFGPGSYMEDRLNTLRPLFGAWVLAAFAALPALAGLYRLRTWMTDRFRRCSAPLVWLLAIPLAMAAIPGRSPLPVELSLLAILAPLGWVFKRPETLGFVGGVAAIATVSAIPGCTAAWVLGAVVILAAALSPKAQVPWWVAGVSLTGASLIVGGIAAFSALLGSWLGAVMSGLAATVVLAAVLPLPRRRERPRAAGLACATLGALYVAAAFMAIGYDAQAGAVLDTLLNQAASARSELGVGSTSALEG